MRKVDQSPARHGHIRDNGSTKSQSDEDLNTKRRAKKNLERTIKNAQKQMFPKIRDAVIADTESKRFKVELTGTVLPPDPAGTSLTLQINVDHGSTEVYSKIPETSEIRTGIELLLFTLAW